MSISKTKNYLVLNYSSSPVGISTKYDSFLVDGGTATEPGTLPLTFDEIAVINSKSAAFKIGLLRFEPAYEEELYEALSITYWRDIMTEADIEHALCHPTLESSQKILDIESDAYFERIRGVMVGLRSAGIDVPGKIERMIEQRRLELAQRKRKTEIRLVSTDEPSRSAPSKEEFDAMKAQLEQMQAMMAAMMNGTQDQDRDATVPEPTSAPVSVDADDMDRPRPNEAATAAKRPAQKQSEKKKPSK